MSKATAQKSQSKKATTRRHLQSASKRKTTPFAIASQFVSSPKGRITVLGAVLTLTCLWLTNTDTNYSFRWLNLTLWMGAVASFFYVCKEKWAKYSGHTKLYVVYSRDTGTRKTTKANKHSWLYRNLAITSVFALTTLLSFLWLTAYPFAGDSVGTIGMNAFGIVNGDIKNIFGTGPSEAFGMISLLFNSAFFTFFGNNLSAMRVPTALIGIADVCLLFLVVRTNFNTRTAVWTSLVMSLLPLHMYFARVNTTAAYASFWTTAILGAFLWALNKRTILSYGMLGITLGVAAGFNFDVRLMGMTTLVATIGLCLYQGFTPPSRKPNSPLKSDCSSRCALSVTDRKSGKLPKTHSLASTEPRFSKVETR